MRAVLSIISLVAALLSVSCKPAELNGRWSEERANEWWSRQEWPVGCNYVPSYAINQIEFWQPETFDEKVIDHELGLAESLGFNTLRIYLHEILWQADREGYKQRIDRFMDIAQRHGQKLIITFFTNGGFYNDPRLGEQPQPVDGVHSSNWIQSPGSHIVNDPSAWAPLKEYIQDILTTYKDSDRVLYWCLYNEPENLPAARTTSRLPRVCLCSMRSFGGLARSTLRNRSPRRYGYGPGRKGQPQNSI